MPLFVVKNNINELDVDAIGLPYCEGMKSCIDELFNIGGNNLKAFFKRQIEDIKEDSVALSPGFGLKAKNIIIYNCSSLEPGSFKNIENYQEKLIGIYESILNYAYAKELDYVAIPVIMPDEAEDDFLSVAVKTVRRFIYNSSRDVTVYLVNSDEYSFYRCDKEDLYNQYLSLNSGVRNYLGLGAFIGHAVAVACDACEESCRKEKNATVINNEYRKRSKKGSFSASDFKRLVADRIEEKDESFSQMVMRIIKERKLDHVRLYRAANVDKDIFSKINKDANGDLDKNGEPFDSILSLSPLGASLSGLDVNITGSTSTNISDGLGSSMALAKGGVAISGHTVDLNTVDHNGLTFDMITTYFDEAKYVARFIADQMFMKKRINIGYNDMVKDGYFNPLTLVKRMTGGLSDSTTQGLATYNTVLGLTITFIKSYYIINAVYPPMRGSFRVFLFSSFVDLLLGIFDAIMGLLSADVYGAGALKSLTPEQVQRQITITNFIKIIFKFAFLDIKMHSYKGFKKGDISYLMIDPEEIKAFSSKLTTDFVKVKATAHNVPINPYTIDRKARMEDYLNLASIDARVKMLTMTALDRIEEAAAAGGLELIMKAYGEVPAFALKSKEGSVSLDSYALKDFKAYILTNFASLDVESGKSEVTVSSPSVELDTISAQTKFSATGKLDISSDLTTKISSGESSIEISPASIKVASASLDQKAAQLQMKAEAAFSIKGSAAKIDTNILNLKTDMSNITSNLIKAS